MNYDDVIPLNEIGKIETVEVYNQAYVDKQQKRITELGELLNSTLEENKDIYKKMADLDTALEDCTESLTDARIKIKELEKENTNLKALRKYELNVSKLEIEKLEKENAELKDKLNNLSKVAEVRLANWQKYEKENKELKEINEGYCRSRDRLASIGLPTFMSCKETVNKLKEAKEIIKQFLNDYPVITKELLDKLEQFIKEDK